AHQRDVLCITIVVIACDVARVPVRRATGRVGETMPDARPGAVRQGRPFDLIRRRRGAPQKAVWETSRQSDCLTNRKLTVILSEAKDLVSFVRSKALSKHARSFVADAPQDDRREERRWPA